MVFANFEPCGKPLHARPRLKKDPARAKRFSCRELPFLHQLG
jgi:hypothetical protein